MVTWPCKRNQRIKVGQKEMGNLRKDYQKRKKK